MIEVSVASHEVVWGGAEGYGPENEPQGVYVRHRHIENGTDGRGKVGSKLGANTFASPGAGLRDDRGQSGCDGEEARNLGVFDRRVETWAVTSQGGRNLGKQHRS